MRLIEFQSLSQDKQINILYRQGVYVGKKKENGITKLLYQLESFYIELIYLKYRRSVHKLHVTDSAAILDPYLEQIEVEYFVN